MNEPILTVKFYATDSGKEPAKEFLYELTKEDRKAAGTDIKTVQFGWPLGMPLVRKMSPDLWEVRTDINDGILRMLFTVQGSMMVLLHGFVKKSDKTPATELKKAQDRLKKLKANVSQKPKARAIKAKATVKKVRK